MRSEKPVGTLLDVPWSTERETRLRARTGLRVDLLRRRRRAARLVVGVAAAASIVIAALSLRSAPFHAPISKAPDLAGLELDTGAGTQHMVLPDGTDIDLAEHTRLRFAPTATDRTDVILLQGGLSVASEGRLWVATSSQTVESNGARFEVRAVESALTEIVVHDGRIVLRDSAAGSETQLHAGERWQAPPPAAPVASAAEPPVPSQLPARRRPKNDADELFARAEAARLAGRRSEAATLYEEYHARFPHDADAPLAALEAGRILLETAPLRAASSFAYAAKRGGIGVRDDAAAGRVDALSRSGDLSACRAARAEYLRDHPTGRHLARVSKTCP